MLIVQAVMRLWKKSVVDPFTFALYLIVFVLHAFSGYVLPVKLPAAVLVLIAGAAGILMSTAKNRRTGKAGDAK